MKSFCVGSFVALAMSSCWELDQEVLSGITHEELQGEVDPDMVEALRQSAYRAVVGNWGGHGSLYSAIEVSSDEMAIPQKGELWDDGGIWLRAHRHTWISTDNHYNIAWQYAFRLVADANFLIVQFPDIEELVAELKVLRALSYLWLIDNFGNVPIVVENEVATNPPTNNRTEVFDFIESSILENVSLLTRNNTRTNLNYWTAHMILAKLYLNAEVYIGQPRWAEAKAVLDVIIDEGPYSLEPNFFANFANSNSNSPENMFTIPYDASIGGFNIHMMTFHSSSQQTFELQDQPWNGYAALEEFYNHYEDADVRKNSLREGPQFSSDGVTPIIDELVEANDPDGPEINFTPYINELAPNALKQAGTRINKFEIPLGSGSSLNNDFPIFRYADVLLMRAEASWRLGETDEALSFVNQVRERANVDPLTSINADVLLAERGRELFAEGHRRSDLIRFGRFNDAWWEKNASESFRNLFPIPQVQLSANPNLTQNPGY